MTQTGRHETGAMSRVVGTWVTVAGAVVIGWSAILVDLSQTGPVTVSIYRLGYAAAVLWILLGVECWCRRRRFTSDLLAPSPRAACAGLLFAVSVLLQNASIDALGAGLATVLDNTHVVVIALATWAITRRAPRRAVLAAVPLVLAGVALIAAAGNPTAGGDGSHGWGVTAALLTACAYAGYVALLRPGHVAAPTTPHPPLILLPITHIVTVALPVALATGVVGGADLTPPAASHGWLILLALGPQVLGWTLISLGSVKLDVLVTGLILTLQPVISLVLAGLVLGEQLSGVQGIGCAVVVLGLVIGTWPGSTVPRIGDLQAGGASDAARVSAASVPVTAPCEACDPAR